MQRIDRDANGKARSPKTKRTQPKPEDLDAMLEHDLGFELSRFLFAWELWPGDKYSGPVLDLLRESCLIHFRLLTEFFFPRRDPKKATKFKDIFVTDYLPDKKRLWPKPLRALLEPRPGWVDKYREKADQQLAHITLERLDIAKRLEKGWSDEPLREMTRIVEEFINALSAERQRLYQQCRWHRWHKTSHSVDKT